MSKSLAHLREVAEHATPGPWTHDAPYLKAVRMSNGDEVATAHRQHYSRLPTFKESYPDADIIAHAPTDLAAALDVIEAAKAEFDGHPFARQELRAALDAFEALP